MFAMQICINLNSVANRKIHELGLQFFKYVTHFESVVFSHNFDRLKYINHTLSPNNRNALMSSWMRKNIDKSANHNYELGQFLFHKPDLNSDDVNLRKRKKGLHEDNTYG